MKDKIECCTCDSISGHGSCPIHKLDVMEMMLRIQLIINEGIDKVFEAGAEQEREMLIKKLKQFFRAETNPCSGSVLCAVCFHDLEKLLEEKEK